LHIAHQMSFFAYERRHFAADPLQFILALRLEVRKRWKKIENLALNLVSCPNRLKKLAVSYNTAQRVYRCVRLRCGRLPAVTAEAASQYL